MTDHAVFEADYTDYKLIKTRSVVQVVLEVPIEQWKLVVDLLGMPLPGSNVPVAVARLAHSVTRGIRAPRDAANGEREGVDSAPANSDYRERYEADIIKHTKPKRPFHEYPPSQQAGILCDDPAFQRWLAQIYSLNPMWKSSTLSTATPRVVRDVCTVVSRTEFDSNPRKAKLWASILTEFEAASGRTAENRG